MQNKAIDKIEWTISNFKVLGKTVLNNEGNKKNDGIIAGLEMAIEIIKEVK